MDRKLIFGSLIITFIGCNLWPFITSDIYYPFDFSSKLFISVLIIRLARDKWVRKGGKIYFCFNVMDLVKESHNLIGLNFTPTQFEIFEYPAAAFFTLTILFIDTWGCRLLLAGQLFFTYPKNLIESCRRMNSIVIAYRSVNVLEYSKVSSARYVRR